MAPKITPEQLITFWKAIDRGSTYKAAAQMADFSYPSASNIVRDQRGRDLVRPPSDRGPGRYGGSGKQIHWSQRSGVNKDPRSQGVEEENLPDPIPSHELSSEALRALEDFHYFSERYFGRVPTPWRKTGADRVLELYESDEKEYAVINVAPGTGKTTLFTHDIPAWLTMRDRAMRGVLGSWGMQTAKTYTDRLRTSFERNALVPVSDDAVKKGTELEPSGILAADFGRIKPLESSAPWTATSFEVVPADGRRSANKEPTWTAFGAGEILGWRVDFLVFDDLVTVRKLDSEAEQQRMRKWWDDEVEKRLEPGGLLLLEGQRLGANDHYRYCLDKVGIDEDDIDIIDIETDGSIAHSRKYHAIIFPAHDLSRCAGGDSKAEHHHPKTAKPWPEGCLIDPKRLKYRDLRREELENPSRYATVFQQNDTNPDTVLVPPAWINGEGEHPGCWDSDRDVWDLPSGLSGELISVISVDPSPTKNWAVQAWAIHPASGSFILLDLFRGSMTLPEFLYGDEKSGSYSGLLEDFRESYARMGLPLRHVIFERNVAQRWFTQMPYVTGWQRKHKVTVHQHETTRNKTDPKYGITMLRPMFRHGQIRLPGMQHETRAAKERGLTAKDFRGRRNSIKLVNEVTTYSLEHGAAGTDDQLMACWMMAHRADDLKRTPVENFPRLGGHLPKWARRAG